MSRKIDIELTSAKPDGTWTWRVAGAKQPKGVLDGGLLPAASKVGDVLRAEAEFELEGTTITSVAQPPGKRPEAGRLELLADSGPFEGVTTSLVPKSGRPRREWDDRGPRTDRPNAAGARAPGRRSDSPAARPDRGPGPRGPRPADQGAPGRPTRDPARPDAGRSAAGRPPGRRPDGRPGDSAPGTGARERSDAPRDGAPRREGAGGRRDGAGGTAGRHEGEAGARRERPAPGPPRPKRLSPANTHRNAVLDSLPPEERAVADQLLQGGIPAVRRALQEQNARSRDDGRPEIKADSLLTLAEELLPRLKGAEWRDRADAAAKDVDEIGLRDLRSVVAGSDAVARDDESRILAKTLREALDRREAAERDTWLAEITTCLDEGRVTRALRVAGRPPDPRSRFPAEMLTRLAEAASAAMGPETPPDRWTALLAAVLESPVRRSVRPAGLPAAPGDALLAAARQASGRIPALAAMLGLQMPPPPGPPRAGAKPPRPPGRPPSRPPRPPARDTSQAPGSGPAPATVAPEAETPTAGDAAPESTAAVAPVGSETITPVGSETGAVAETAPEMPATPEPILETADAHETAAPAPETTDAHDAADALEAELLVAVEAAVETITAVDALGAIEVRDAAGAPDPGIDRVSEVPYAITAFSPAELLETAPPSPEPAPPPADAG